MERARRMIFAPFLMGFAQIERLRLDRVELVVALVLDEVAEERLVASGGGPKPPGPWGPPAGPCGPLSGSLMARVSWLMPWPRAASCCGSPLLSRLDCRACTSLPSRALGLPKLTLSVALLVELVELLPVLLLVLLLLVEDEVVLLVVP